MERASKRLSRLKAGEYQISNGYKFNQHRDPTRYYGRVYLIAHKKYSIGVARAIENDFGFTTNRTIDWHSWNLRGIRYVPSYRARLKEFFATTSRTRLGCVFIVCGARVHRPAIFVDRDKHLVMLVPPITYTNWGNLGIFKKAADYLNITNNHFRPD